MQRSLAASSIGCARLLNELSALLHEDDCAQRTALQQTDVEDQSARFQVWAGNLGAFQRLPAAASLDHRLRESPKIATQIHELLEDLETATEDVRAITLGERQNRGPGQDLGINIDDDDDCDKESQTDSDTRYDSSEDDTEELSEAQEIFESIKDTIASLFRLAVLIRKATPRDRYARAVAGQNPFIEDFDISHVAHKFPKLNNEASRWLKERLGKAITQRRQYLRYAREHRYKLGKEPTELWKPIIDPRKDRLHLPFDSGGSQTGKSHTSRPVTTLADTTASTLFLQEATHEEIDLHDERSQTSFALSALDGDNLGRVQLPKLSEVSKNQTSFECPFCWTIQSFRREKAWKKHALSDLRPYVCTSVECDLKLFVDRKSWFEHELTLHWAQWHCHFCARDDFKSKESFREHIQCSHTKTVHKEQLDALVEACRRPKTRFAASDCPFCTKWEMDLRTSNVDIIPSEPVNVTPADFRHHVGSHMQDLALFAIPRGYLEGDGPEGASGASARAAGVGNDSASVAILRSHHSMDSYDSVDGLVIERLSADVARCSEILEKSRLDTGTVFAEALIRVLPILDETQLKFIRSPTISTAIKVLPNDKFRSFAEAIYNGRQEAEERYFMSCASSTKRTSMHYNIAGYIFDGVGVGDHLTWRNEHPDRLEALLGLAFKGSSYSSNLLEALSSVAIHGKGLSKTFTSDEEILAKIAELQAKDSAGNTVKACAEELKWFLSLSNRYIRKLFRMYAKRYPEGDLLKLLIVRFDRIVDTNDSIRIPINTITHNSAFEDVSQGSPLSRNLISHVVKGALDPVTRDARRLHESFCTIDSAYATENHEPNWTEIEFLILSLHWRRNHMRAVKSGFEDLFSTTVESELDTLRNYPSADDMYISLLTALLDVEHENQEGSFLSPPIFMDQKPVGVWFCSDCKDGPRLEWQVNCLSCGHQKCGKCPTEANAKPSPAPELFEASANKEHLWESIGDLFVTILAFQRLMRRYRKRKGREQILHAMRTVESSSHMPVWHSRLMNYPMFSSCPLFFDVMRQYMELQIYDPGELILAKGNSTPWVGWLIMGDMDYTATYNPRDSKRSGRREYTTAENALAIGLADTLLDLPSLIHLSSITTCLIAAVPKDLFKQLVREYPEVEQYIAAHEFGKTFPVARECLRIEIEFGHPWWHIFDAGYMIELDRPEIIAQILATSSDPTIVTSLISSVSGEDSTPLDMVLSYDDVESAIILIEYGAIVSPVTIQTLVRTANRQFLEILLKRPGGAEAANMSLRSGSSEHVSKLQAMLKEMQGSVPLVAASSTELAPAATKTATVTHANDCHVDTIVAESRLTDQPEMDDQVHSLGLDTVKSDEEEASSPIALFDSDLPFTYDEFQTAIKLSLDDSHDSDSSCVEIRELLDRFDDRARAASFLNSKLPHGTLTSTPLSEAVQHNQIKLISLLLDYGADPNQADARGYCPLYYALHGPGSKSAMGQLLLDHGAIKINSYAQNFVGEVKELIRIEKEHGLDWFTLLQTSKDSSENHSSIRQILTASPDPRLTANLRNENEQSSFFIAVGNDDAELALLLWEFGATSGELDGLTALLADPALDPKFAPMLRECRLKEMQDRNSPELTSSKEGEENQSNIKGEQNTPQQDQDKSKDLELGVRENVA